MRKDGQHPSHQVCPRRDTCGGAEAAGQPAVSPPHSRIDTHVVGGCALDQCGSLRAAPGYVGTRTAQELEADVSKLRDSAALASLAAEVHVSQLKLTVLCLENAIERGRNLSHAEFNRMAASADERIDKEYVRASTTIEDFTWEKAEQELSDAKSKAERVCGEAELEEKKAKVKLKAANQELQELNMRGVEEDIESVLKQSETFVLKPLASGRAYGMSKFAYDVDSRIQSFTRDCATCLLLRGTPGIGKTIAMP